MQPAGRRLFSWKDPRVISGETSYGKGTFASSEIAEGSLLMIFGGYVFTLEEESRLPEKIRDAALQIDRNFVIGILEETDYSETDSVNHSCDPNAGIKGQISLVAMRNIPKGEEITFDYGTVLVRKEGAPEYEIACSCDSKECRKKITHSDWKSRNFQEKYRGYLPYYVLEEIAEADRKS